MNDFDDLIARLEAETTGSRGVDAQIGRVAEVTPKIVAVRSRNHYIGGQAVKLRDKEEWPRYTTSLDAALTLVPEGCAWMVRSGDWAKVWLPNRSPPGNDFDATAGTPILALCIAALKARAAQKAT